MKRDSFAVCRLHLVLNARNKWAKKMNVASCSPDKQKYLRRARVVCIRATVRPNPNLARSLQYPNIARLRLLNMARSKVPCYATV
jgi:hypothetical protein